MGDQRPFQQLNAGLGRPSSGPWRGVSGGLRVEGPGQHKPLNLLMPREWQVGGHGPPQRTSGRAGNMSSPCWPPQYRKAPQYRKMAKLSSHFHLLYGAVQGGGDFHSESNTEKMFKAKAYGKSNAVLRTMLK